MFESTGGDIFAWLRNLGGTSGTGAMAAPGMADAGYTLAPGLTQSTSDPAQPGGNWFGTGATNKDVSSALGNLGKSAGGDAGADQRPIMPGGGAQAPIGGGHGGGVSLDALVQMLAKRRQGLMPGGGSQGATGLLGF